MKNEHVSTLLSVICKQEKQRKKKAKKVKRMLSSVRNQIHQIRTDLQNILEIEENGYVFMSNELMHSICQQVQLSMTTIDSIDRKF